MKYSGNGNDRKHKQYKSTHHNGHFLFFASIFYSVNLQKRQVVRCSTDSEKQGLSNELITSFSDNVCISTDNTMLKLAYLAKRIPGYLCGLRFHPTSKMRKMYSNQADDWGSGIRNCTMCPTFSYTSLSATPPYTRLVRGTNMLKRGWASTSLLTDSFSIIAKQK